MYLISLSSCLSISVFNLRIYLPIIHSMTVFCLTVYPPIHLPTVLFFYLSNCLSIHPSPVCLSVCMLSTRLLVRPFTHPSKVCLSICRSTHYPPIDWFQLPRWKDGQIGSFLAVSLFIQIDLSICYKRVRVYECKCASVLVTKDKR